MRVFQSEHRDRLPTLARNIEEKKRKRFSGERKSLFPGERRKRRETVMRREKEMIRMLRKRKKGNDVIIYSFILQIN